MRHIVWISLALTALFLGPFFTVRILHHGKVAADYFEETVIDSALAYLPQEELYPDEKSEAVFGKDGFNKAFPDLAKTQDIGEIMSHSDTIRRGWIVEGKDKDNTLRVSRIYWNSKLWWQSNTYDLVHTKHYIERDILKDVEDSLGSRTLITTLIEGATPEEFWNGSERLFGNGTFTKLYPDLKPTQNPGAFLENTKDVSRGWIVRDGAPAEIRRVYWNESEIAISGWHDLDSKSHTIDGIFRKPHFSSWDGSSGSNSGTMVGMIFGEVIALIVIFGAGEALFASNSDYRRK